jgi:hypothetical protein
MMSQNCETCRTQISAALVSLRREHKTITHRRDRLDGIIEDSELAGSDLARPDAVEAGIKRLGGVVVIGTSPVPARASAVGEERQTERPRRTLAVLDV